MEKFSLTNADNKSQVQTKKIPQYTVYRYGFMENRKIMKFLISAYTHLDLATAGKLSTTLHFSL